MLGGLVSRLYQREQFNPGPLGLLVNPFYFARRGLHEQVKAARGHLRGRLLDVGCGQKPYRSLMDVEDYVGLEIDSPSARYAGTADAYYDGKTFPFADASFDSVLTNQVLEHVFTPTAFLAEISRVLKPGGSVVITVPFVWDEHEQPYDYARYSSFGLKHLLETSGFEVVAMEKSMADVRVLFQLINAYLYKLNPFTTSRLRLAYNLTYAAPVNLVGELLSRFTPANPDLYLDNFVVARKPAPA
jgi:SAM-dependent methyltransferase